MARSRARVGVLAVVGILVLVVIGVVAWAVVKLVGGGPQPAEALPASTTAMVSVDLDPSAGQKVEAIKTLQKFPDLRSRLHLSSTSDLRKYLFDMLVSHRHCGQLSYAKDVQPWIGDRAALAQVPVSGRSVSVVALQVSDSKAAHAGLAKVASCAGPHSGFVVGKDYALLTGSTAQARQIQAATKPHNLADDASYQKWMGAAGSSGEVNFYVAKGAARLGLKMLAQHTRLPAAVAGQMTSLQALLKSFQGLGGTVRFTGGGVELSVAAGGVSGLGGNGSVTDSVNRMPSNAAAVLALSVPPHFAQHLVARLNTALGGNARQLVAEAQQRFGISLPGDLQTLLGQAVVVSLGGTPPPNLAGAGPGALPIGVQVTGNTNNIGGVLKMIETHIGATPAALGLTQKSDGHGHYVVATDPAYAAKLVKGGNLGDDPDFKSAVPDAHTASSLAYLRLTPAWRSAIVNLVNERSGPTKATQVSGDLAPLDAFGLATWSDGSTSRVDIRLTTK